MYHITHDGTMITAEKTLQFQHSTQPSSLDDSLSFTRTTARTWPLKDDVTQMDASK
ncbi:hypothetical protein Q1695_010829 [Nippostrongylus brasiliensis]|nr:hypothetical protein Q1695_010829 [Nippostrongylus brasiliensis]